MVLQNRMKTNGTAIQISNVFGALFISLLVFSACQQKNNTKVSNSLNNADTMDTTGAGIPLPERIQILFGDSSNRALFWDGESIVHQKKGDILQVDGLAILYISNATLPLKLHASLMDIEVLELPLLLQIDAFDKHAGQSLEVFSGTLKVGKSYKSPFPEVDTLHANDLYMINKDIDLSEKERLDDFSVRHWWEKVYSKKFPNVVADSLSRSR